MFYLDFLQIWRFTVVAGTSVTERRWFKLATSRREASQAGKDLRNPKTPKQDRGPIGSALAQTPRKK